MESSQLIENKVRSFSFKNYAEKEAGRLVLELFLILKKALYKIKASG